ncbi:MAG: NAD-dependent epimerase/dehydratase family protein, partial [candidate division Zixibacteria bacterium]|nr:NAD-dependent epimerase/dehydratase family protein [candidate division Zixibacteria bacterium]
MPENSKESVLITGANGFVGSHLCRRMLEDGYRPIAGIRRGCNI